MNQEIKARWVAALRDPERKQIQFMLKTPNGCCVSGVLCELAAQDNIVEMDFDSEFNQYLFDGNNSSSIPEVVERWGEFEQRSLKIPREALTKEEVELFLQKGNHGDSYTIVTLNDAGFSFSRLADLIERYL